MSSKDVTEEEINELKRFTWKRAGEILAGKPYTLYKEIEIEDINQGQIGNCYFLSAVSAIAEFKQRFEKIFITKTKSENGCYTMEFILQGIPKIVSIDDHFIHDPKTHRFAGATSGPGEIWVQVLEKAWAKVNGSYAATIAGLPGEALASLTDAPVVSYIHKKYPDNKINELWNIIKNADENKWIICTNTGNNKDAEAMGLVESHAYTVIGVHEDNDIRLVKLRNPWGQFEWKGDFADGSPLWEKYPKLKNQVELNRKDDGIFYMSFKDFLTYYPYTFICMYEEFFEYRFQKVHQINNDTMTAVKIIITKPTKITIGLHQKQQRFYHAVKNYKPQMTRILLAKFNSDKDNCYDFINSDSNDNEKLYIICENLLPGEYHIFSNVNWPYDKKCRYVISTYANVPVEIEELDPKFIPADYLSMILGSFIDKNYKTSPMTSTSTFQQSFNDNDTGFYMIYFKNKSEDESLKVQVECLKNEKCMLITENLVSEHKIQKNKDGIKIDSLTVNLNPNSSVMLIWRLTDNFWHSRMEMKIISCQPSNYVATTLKDNNKILIDENINCLNKENISLDIFYSELETENGVLLIFENRSVRNNHLIKLNFEELKNLNLVSPRNSILKIPRSEYQYAHLKKIEFQKPLNFIFSCSLKKY